MLFVRFGWTEEITHGFDKVKDLVRGTIETENVDEIWEAYHHLKEMKEIEIISIKNNLKKLKNLNISYIYDEAFIGEMQFRFGDLPENYHGNHFVYAVERSMQKIELLETLST